MNNAAALPYIFVRFSGDDAKRFLQGQLSCDVDALADLNATFGTANTAKGRAYLLFVLFRDGADYVMRIHNSIAEQGLANLAKYMVFFKCEMNIEDDLKAYAVKPDTIEADARPESYHKVTKLSETYIWHCPGKEPRFEAWSTQEPSETIDEVQWFVQDCNAGIPELYPETQEKFILQQLNLHELHAVSFKKGCYTGQEIIARMKFLGKLKKKMYQVTSDEKASSLPSSSIYDHDGKKSGDMVRWHSTDHSGTGLAVLDISAVDANQTFFLDPEKKVVLQVKSIDY